MGDSIEEPPTKVTKYEMESQYLEGEVMEEGQEEWLSEGVLTDDDYNPVNSQHSETDANDSSALNQDVSMGSVPEDHQTDPDVLDNIKVEGSNIEETLNNFEKTVDNDVPQDSADELETFLIRKSDGKPLKLEQVTKGSDIDESAKQSEDDGNDTDDLLRVLGDDDQKAKKNDIKKEKDDTSDDDDYIFNGTKVGANLQAAKNALMRASARKAQPEDDDETDCSSDEVDTVKKMFMMKPDVKNTNVQKSTNNKSNDDGKTQKVDEKKTMKKHVVQINAKPTTMKFSAPKMTTSTPIKISTNKKPNDEESSVKKQPVIVKKQPVAMKKQSPVVKKQAVEAKKPPTVVNKQPVVVKKPPPEEIIDEQKFHEEDDIELDEEFTERESESTKPTQRLMKPEQMDEEVPTDAESDTDEDSIYDELPSSDSEDLNQWFTLDIRAERAGDYLPLLGDRAFQLLTEEKRRVTARLQSLKSSLSALTENGKEQAEKLREATTSVSELDAMLKAA